MLENLEEELRKWRQSRASKPQREAPSDRRTVKVNGQEVLVVRKKASKPKKGDPDEIVCEKITAIGSRVATKRVCATRTEWAEKRKLDKEAMEQAQRMGNAPCQTTGSSSGSGTGRPSC